MWVVITFIECLCVPDRALGAGAAATSDSYRPSLMELVVLLSLWVL